jgi:hypothetical protein
MRERGKRRSYGGDTNGYFRGFLLFLLDWTVIGKHT